MTGPGPRIGSLCSGYGGLDRAVTDVFGGHVAWHADNHPAAAQVLAHHWPTTPNLGDITAVDWTAVPAVDVLAGGFPCQGNSVAGQRKGTRDERWIFDAILAAARDLRPRPRLLVLENVPGLLTVEHGDAMARVVLGLAALGYMGAWRTVAASDIGAAHQRRRVFLLAWPAADPGGPRLARRRTTRPTPHHGGDARGLTLLPTPRVSDTNGTGTHGTGGIDLRTAVTTLLPTPRATDGTKGGPNQRGSAGEPALSAVVQPERWGRYLPAVRRWEHVTGHPAPAPTAPNRDGQPRLAPMFVEWLMGLDPGHVTAVPGLSRTAQLRLLGNGVVPRQAAHALDLLTREMP
ncbi:DNA cytosine methyltransferase [Yinghuangia seranimata]|uniref:DNA cytosine methyltransferase n=1 Tax=Yinghuangia seranimata TaxID=408067 RepID=UPI00248BF3E5|nr:DNA (cytosine-5-)-methyltransferase [Yinghuangia seranimata]MDI2128745.1 DNA (cytosine-5-)-methyltransferase [Yinghuangia seranimata]